MSVHELQNRELIELIDNLRERLNNAEEELREIREINDTNQDARLRLVVEHMPVMMNALDEHDNFVVWNKECERVTGYRADEIINNPNAFTLLYPNADYRKRLLSKMFEYSGTNTSYHIAIGSGSSPVKTDQNELLHGAIVPFWLRSRVGILGEQGSMLRIANEPKKNFSHNQSYSKRS
ncbi:MAG: PAS domain S-box protein [candidate division Zixibacteria bacterium]|nr:PAS domain S-box protein [candidate division Zixibacteria bacterium]